MNNNTGVDIRKLFSSAALGALKMCGRVIDTENDPNCDTALVAYAEWGGDAKFNSFEDVASAVVDFTNWARSWGGYHPEPAVVIDSIDLSVDLPFGKSTLHFTIHGTPHDFTGPGIGKAYIEMYDQLQDIYRVFWQARGRKSEPSPDDTNGNKGGDFDNFSFDRIEVDVVKGKRVAKVFGGQWQKFGVTVWPEVLEAAGLPIDDLEDGTNEIEGQASALMVNGKPKKITRLKIAD